MNPGGEGQPHHEHSSREHVLERIQATTFLTLFNKLKSLQGHDIAQNYRILRKVAQRLSQQNLNISNHCHI
jgi:hypothetical protein